MSGYLVEKPRDDWLNEIVEHVCERELRRLPEPVLSKEDRLPSLSQSQIDCESTLPPPPPTATKQPSSVSRTELERILAAERAAVAAERAEERAAEKVRADQLAAVFAEERAAEKVRADQLAAEMAKMRADFAGSAQHQQHQQVNRQTIGIAAGVGVSALPGPTASSSAHGGSSAVSAEDFARAVEELRYKQEAIEIRQEANEIKLEDNDVKLESLNLKVAQKRDKK